MQKKHMRHLFVTIGSIEALHTTVEALFARERSLQRYMLLITCNAQFASFIFLSRRRGCWLTFKSRGRVHVCMCTDREEG